MTTKTECWPVAQDKTPFDEGARAKRRGATWFACPYSDAYRRNQWFDGYDSEPRKDHDNQD